MNKLIRPCAILCLLLWWSAWGTAQCTPGSIITPAAAGAYSSYLNPDGDGFITASGAAFTSDTTEAAEFKNIPASTSGWVKLVDVNEVSGDVTPNCGSADLVTDNNGGDFAYYNIVDPTPASPSSGDEAMLVRFRLAKVPNGSFGYNFLIDSDMSYGGGIDANGICGNQGFEREIQFANAGGKVGVSVYNIDGATSFLSALCSQCVSNAQVQRACAASSGDCATSDPAFTTFPVPLVHLGIPSDVDVSTLYIAAGTANSGNATSVLGGKNASDVGGLDGSNQGCAACAGLTGCQLFDCQTDCVSDAFVEANLPITLAGFNVVSTGGGHRLQWATEREENNAYFHVEHSTDGLSWTDIARLAGGGTTAERRIYTYLNAHPVTGRNYYRLRQQDQDGKISHSPVRYLAGPRGTDYANDLIRLYPTVVRDGYLLANSLRWPRPELHLTFPLDSSSSSPMVSGVNRTSAGATGGRRTWRGKWKLASP